MRLIDADALKEQIPETREDIFENCRRCTLLDASEVLGIIDEAPTIEAEPIRHGEWLMDDESGDIKCSCCGHWSFDMYDEPFVVDGHKCIATIMPHYCGYCGAKMD